MQKKKIQLDFTGYKQRIWEDVEERFEEALDAMDMAIFNILTPEEEKQAQRMLSEELKKIREIFYSDFKKDLYALEIQDADELDDGEVDNVMNSLSFIHRYDEEAIENMVGIVEFAGYHLFKSDSILTDQKIEDFLEHLKQQPY